jgi:hypothetical protein
MEHVPQTLQCAADRGLAEQKASGGSGDITLFRENAEDDQQIEVRLAQLRDTHT